MVLLGTSQLVTLFEDEAGFILAARRNLAESLGAFAVGNPDHMHPPFPDIILHLWLRAAGVDPALIRIPFIACYCLGLWMISDTAERLWNKGWTALFIGIASPFGYFMGHAAGWYSLTFLEIAILTWLYFRWRAATRRTNLTLLGVCALLLIYTNYLGWVFIAVLYLDLIATDKNGATRSFLAMIAGLAIAYLPLVPAFVPLVHSTIASARGSILETISHGVYLTYSLMSSEMIAPWSWPGVISAFLGIVVLFACAKQRESRRFLLWLVGSLGVSLCTGGTDGGNGSLYLVPGCCCSLRPWSASPGA
jgi:hypothetical protein